ncbi:MBL fold metallo-hydrolase [Halomarina oriensis]|uniref:MBL fold metallo-hydrolase n=1 Tax=Halomarina oriensis TaxID=671145 RepID=A0A6B0GQD7_9EURY|nr:MBL fold metallo-hydrolase [Halomarina oriensis]MWG35809.1 MBL fold metallo-hydrolase [Halomarina oriensis]
MTPPVRPVRVAPATYLLDAHLFGTPGALSAYVLDAERPVLVDAGTADSVDRFAEALDRLAIAPADVAAVLVTHVHLDHAGGAGALADHCENATVYVHERGVGYLTDPERLARLRESVDAATGRTDPYGVPQPIPEDRVVAVSGGETLDCGDHTLEFVDAPGHAPHHYAVFDETTDALFAIDSAGQFFEERLYPTTPPPSFDLDANVETCERLRALEPSLNLYGHFGPGGDDAVGELERYADLLTEWVEAVETLAGVHGDVTAIVEALDGRWQSPTVERDVAGVLAARDAGST